MCVHARGVCVRVCARVCVWGRVRVCGCDCEYLLPPADLLHRLQMWGVAANVIARSSLPEVNCLNKVMLRPLAALADCVLVVCGLKFGCLGSAGKHRVLDGVPAVYGAGPRRLPCMLRFLQVLCVVSALQLWYSDVCVTVCVTVRACLCDCVAACVRV